MSTAMCVCHSKVTVINKHVTQLHKIIIKNLLIYNETNIVWTAMLCRYFQIFISY